MALSTLTAKLTTAVNWNAGLDQSAGLSQPVVNQNAFTKTENFGTAAGNSTSGGGDEIFFFDQAIVAGGSATIDLTGMTDVISQAVAIVRIKGVQVRLLSGSDDSSLSPVPTASSTISVTNNGPTLPNQWYFGTGGSGLTLTLGTSGGVISTAAISAAGSLYPKSATFLVSPVQSSGAAGLISVATNTTGVPTTVAVVKAGTGYSNATVPSVAIGYWTLTTGDAIARLDLTAAGVTVSSTLKNISVLNNDASNAVTVEFTILGATS